MAAMYNAEQAKVRELEQDLEKVQQAIFDLNTNSLDNPNSSINSYQGSDITFEQKMIEIEQQLMVAQEAGTIQLSREALQEDNVKYLKQIGQLERQLEHYRLRLSPTNLESKISDGHGSGAYGSSGGPNQEELDLIKQYEEQNEDLMERLTEKANQEKIAQEKIQALESDFNQVYKENVSLQLKNESLVKYQHELEQVRDELSLVRTVSRDKAKDLEAIVAMR